ncbi:MAG: hypothetical protein K9L17_13070 [Clostridiales bacterium]|nr:hypothetical protein [Clostridiales bacterium]MCF8023610.1 hypothetical protein [Clostridiales bacterium]
MRSMLSNFPTEKVKLIKKDGSIFDNIEALVETGKVFARVVKGRSPSFSSQMGSVPLYGCSQPQAQPQARSLWL